jgi:hypothetical protein
MSLSFFARYLQTLSCYMRRLFGYDRLPDVTSSSTPQELSSEYIAHNDGISIYDYGRYCKVIEDLSKLSPEEMRIFEQKLLKWQGIRISMDRITTKEHHAGYNSLVCSLQESPPGTVKLFAERVQQYIGSNVFQNIGDDRTIEMGKYVYSCTPSIGWRPRMNAFIITNIMRIYPLGECIVFLLPKLSDGKVFFSCANYTEDITLRAHFKLTPKQLHTTEVHNFIVIIPKYGVPFHVKVLLDKQRWCEYMMYGFMHKQNLDVSDIYKEIGINLDEPSFWHVPKSKLMDHINEPISVKLILGGNVGLDSTVRICVSAKRTSGFVIILPSVGDTFEAESTFVYMNEPAYIDIRLSISKHNEAPLRNASYAFALVVILLNGDRLYRLYDLHTVVPEFDKLIKD